MPGGWPMFACLFPLYLLPLEQLGHFCFRDGSRDGLLFSHSSTWLLASYLLPLRSGQGTSNRHGHLGGPRGKAHRNDCCLATGATRLTRSYGSSLLLLESFELLLLQLLLLFEGDEEHIARPCLDQIITIKNDTKNLKYKLSAVPGCS